MLYGQPRGQCGWSGMSKWEKNIKKSRGKEEREEEGRGIWRRLYRILLVKVSTVSFILSNIRG